MTFSNSVYTSDIKVSDYVAVSVGQVNSWDNQVIVPYASNNSTYWKFYLVSAGGSATSNVSCKVYCLKR